jgi:CheY-like chemotaxis protein
MISTYDSINLLIIEDEPSEQKLLKLCIEKTGYATLIKFINNGEDAIKYAESFPDREEIMKKIHLILIDINIPRIDGHHVLVALKKNEALKKVPAVVLTTSNNRADVEKAYLNGAAGFILKPKLIEDYETALNHLFKYWFELCLIP